MEGNHCWRAASAAQYVHGEVSERLQDWRCAEQIETCIEHLKAECVL